MATNGNCLICGQSGCDHPKKEKAARKFLAKLIYGLVFTMPKECLAEIWRFCRKLESTLAEAAEPREDIRIEPEIDETGRITVRRVGRYWAEVDGLIDLEVVKAFTRMNQRQTEFDAGQKHLTKLWNQRSELIAMIKDATALLKRMVQKNHPIMGWRILMRLHQHLPLGLPELLDTETKTFEDRQHNIEELENKLETLNGEIGRLVQWQDQEGPTGLRAAEDLAWRTLEAKHPDLHRLLQERKLKIRFDESTPEFFCLLAVDETAYAQAHRDEDGPDFSGVQLFILVGKATVHQKTAQEFANFLAAEVTKQIDNAGGLPENTK